MKELIFPCAAGDTTPTFEPCARTSLALRAGVPCPRLSAGAVAAHGVLQRGGAGVPRCCPVTTEPARLCPPAAPAALPDQSARGFSAPEPLRVSKPGLVSRTGSAPAAHIQHRLPVRGLGLCGAAEMSTELGPFWYKSSRSACSAREFRVVQDGQGCAVSRRGVLCSGVLRSHQGLAM